MRKQLPTVMLDPKRVTLVLGIIAFVLFTAHCIGLVLTFALHHDYVYGLVPLFNLGSELNAPTFFSTGLILINAALFLCVWKAASVAGEKHWIWLFLSIVFCYLSLDEFFGLHERLEAPTREAFNATGIFYFAWIIPYMIALFVLAIFVIPVIRRLDRNTRNWFVLSAVTFIAGAIGIEMIGGNYFEAHGGEMNLSYRLIQTVEESLELAGLLILVYAILHLLKNRYGGFIFAVPGPQDSFRSSGGTPHRTSR